MTLETRDMPFSHSHYDVNKQGDDVWRIKGTFKCDDVWVKASDRIVSTSNFTNINGFTI